MKDKTPTPSLEEKVKQYEDFLHKINLFIISCNNDGIKELIKNADNWSYSHRHAEFISDNERQKMINNAFWKLLDTPISNKLTEDMQKKYSEFRKTI
jgi:hypothetical protein